MHIFIDGIGVFCGVMGIPQVENDLGEGMVLFLHFLMMTPALFSFSRANEQRHRFENFIQSPHLLVDEVIMMNLQKPMILLVFLD